MKVIIMRGLPGSGKTHWRKSKYPNAYVCSADDYHTGADGVYRFVPANADEAHRRCLSMFLGAMQANEDEAVVVDNTNTTAWEISPYLQLAKLFANEVEIVYLDCSVAAAVVRNVHGVPKATIERMNDNLILDRLPPWWKQTRIEVFMESEREHQQDHCDRTRDPDYYQDNGGEA